MNNESLLKQLDVKSLMFNKTLEISDQELAVLQENIFSTGLLKYRVYNITAILCLLHDAFTINPEIFLKKVFIPWGYLKNKATPYYEKIMHNMSTINATANIKDNDIYPIIEIYRSIVSEIFDPYLTILYASYKFMESTDIDIFILNVAEGERQKYEYISSRLRCDEIFSGYNPVVRNAISHTGSNGIVINGENIHFKAIKRGNPPKISHVQWTVDELCLNILKIYEFINSMNICYDIFIADNKGILFGDFDIFGKSIYYLSDDDDSFENISAIAEKSLSKIRNDAEKDFTLKLAELSSILNKNCALRKIIIPEIDYSEKYIFMTINFNEETPELSNDKEIKEKIYYMIRYAILAKTVYGELFYKFIVIGLFNNNNKILACMESEILENYIYQRAGIVDIVNDSKFSYNDIGFCMKVDFDKLAEKEMDYLGKPFPRMQR